MSLHRSTAWPLTWVAVALVVYATLYPWSGWQWPAPGVMTWVLPKLRTNYTFDLVGNLLGYIPLGAVLCIALLRSDNSPAGSALISVLCCSALSYGLELIQFTLPGRVPSISDWTLNTLGAAWGVLAAMTAQALGLLEWWHGWRERWFIPQAGMGLVLLWLWPLGLLFPPPLPLAEGQLWPTLHWMLLDWSEGTTLQAFLMPDDDLLGAFLSSQWPGLVMPRSVPSGLWPPLRDGVTVGLGLLAPMTVACALARPPVLRLSLLVGGWFIAVLVTTLSTAMNYGPEHALTWLSMPVLLGLLGGAIGGGLLLARSRATSAVVGLFVLAALVWLVHQVPADPYYAQTLQAWESGRFIRFHGLSRWFGMLWPYAAFVWLFGRAVGRSA
jgi:VanZ family protein